MGFLNLCQLSIHVELGVRRMELEWKLKEQLGRQLKRQMREYRREQFADDSGESWDEMDIKDYEDWREEWMASVLTESKAQDFGKRFYGRRHEPSSLEKITLRTGEKLRHFPQRPARYSLDEDQYERIFEIHSPPKKGDEPFLKELESQRDRMARKTNERLDCMFGPLKRVSEE